MLVLLAVRVEETLITLTGDLKGDGLRVVHRRLARTRAALETDLRIPSEPLPAMPIPEPATALTHLGRTFLGGGCHR